MKRFHVHLHVDDLNRSIGFYSRLFAARPARLEADHAKWMLEDCCTPDDARAGTQRAASCC